MAETLSITLAGRACVVPETRRLSRRANSYWCPLGPAAGRAWLLMLRQDVAAIHAAAAPYLPLSFKLSTAGQAPVEALFPALVFVKSTRLLAGQAQDGHGLHLVELADKRLLVERFSDTGNLQFNVRSYAQAESYLAGTEGHTWASVAAALWNTMSDVLGPFPGWPSQAPASGAPENLRFLGVNGWRALHGVLAQAGCTTAYDPLADKFSIVALGGLPAASQSTGNLLYDAEPLENEGARFPATVRVYFPTHYRSLGQERDTERDDNWSVVSPLFAVDVPTQVPGARPGTVAPLWDDLPRVLDEDNVPENSAAVTARAEARAAQWVADMRTSGQRRQQVFAGLRTDVRPGAQVKAVLWRAWGARYGGTATEFVSHAGLPRQVRGGSSLGDGLTWTSLAAELESFAPLDLARRTFPSYPRLPNFVQVQDGASDLGALVEANELGLFPGVVVRYVAGSMTTLEHCWIRPCSLALCDTPDAAAVAPLRQGDCYYGRLSGVETHAGETRPLYVVEGERWAKRLGGGPAHALLWQNAAGGWPQWHRSPTVARSLQLGVSQRGFLRLGDAAFVRQHNPATGGEYDLVWPTAKPLGVNAHLYVAARVAGGSCHQLEWGAQGCDFEGYGYFGYACADLHCTYITIRRGIVTNVEGLSVNPPPGDSGTVSCSASTLAPHDPCAAVGWPAQFMNGGAWNFVSGGPFTFVS